MILSRAKPALLDGNRKTGSRKSIPKLEEYLEKRDYSGALTLLEFSGNKTKTGDDTEMWIAYCSFHLGDYKRAAKVYEKQRKNNPKHKHATSIPENLACCYFFLGMYPEAQKILNDAPESPLKTRLLFHLSHKMGDEKKLTEYHKMLQDNIEDQMCLASIHYLRAHYQEAIDIYKKVLLDNSKDNRKKETRTQDIDSDVYLITQLKRTRDYLALNVYVALCYYKLDYYDVAQEVLQVYLQKYPDSAIAINLTACNNFRQYDGNAAQTEMKQLADKTNNTCSFGHDLIRHNIVFRKKIVSFDSNDARFNIMKQSFNKPANSKLLSNLKVFRNGEGALQVLPNLVDVIPEARLNLVIYHLKQHDVQEAFELIKDLEPAVPQEYILKGIVNAATGQETGSRESIKTAQQYFQLVGSSASECDTIPGRQCMASCFFLRRQFEEVLVYLNSIKTYFSTEDSFNFNYAQAQTASGYFKEAEDALLMIRNDRYKNDYTYISLLAYCYVMNKKAQLAWELYLKMDTSTESFNLLQLIGNTCYKIGEFWYSAKAFDMLERMDPTSDHWEGKRGACCGAFQYVVAEKQPKELLREIIQLLRNTSNSQVEQIIRVMRKWGKDNRISC